MTNQIERTIEIAITEGLDAITLREINSNDGFYDPITDDFYWLDDHDLEMVIRLLESIEETGDLQWVPLSR